MKNFLPFVFLIFFTSCTSVQYMTSSKYVPTDEKGIVTYSQAIEVDGVSKNELYIRARKWFSDNIKNSKSVLDVDDKESGLLIGKTFADYQVENIVMKNKPLNYRNEFSIKIYVKDNKYKYEFTDIKIQQQGYPQLTAERYFLANTSYNKEGAPKAIIQNIMDSNKNMYNTLAVSLNQAMNSKITKDF